MSGRGVGLASVKQEIESVGGKIEVVSKLGRGTTFLIKLPILEKKYCILVKYLRTRHIVSLILMTLKIMSSLMNNTKVSE